MMSRIPPVIRGFNASGLLATVSEYEDPAPIGKTDDRRAEDAEPLDLQPDEPMRQSFIDSVRANRRMVEVNDDVGEELPEMPSDLIHLIGADSRYIEEPPVDDCAIPVDEDLMAAIVDANG